MSSPKPVRYIVAGVAAVVLAFGGYMLGNSKSDNGTSGTADAAQSAVPQNGQAPDSGRFGQDGQAPPGFGTPVTGAAADKAKAAALARYRGGVEQVMKLQDGSYVVHVITSSTEYHVHVSKAFKVIGADQGGPGGRGAQGGPGGSSGATS